MTEPAINDAAIARAGWWVAHRLLALLVEKNLLTHQDAIRILDEGVKGMAEPGASETNRGAALLLEQVKTYHQKSAGMSGH